MKRLTAEADYGKLENTYKDGTKSYVKEVNRFDRAAEVEWFTMWDSVIVAEFVERFKGEFRRRDVEFSREDGSIVVYVGDLAETLDNESLLHEPGKLFFNTTIGGTVETYVKPDGTTSTSIHPDKDKILFEYSGEKQ